MEQKQANSISNIIGAFLILLGIMVLMLGISLIPADNKGRFEYILMFMLLGSGSLLLYGAISFIRKSRAKTKQVDEYVKHLQKEISQVYVNQPYNAEVIPAPIINPEIESIQPSRVVENSKENNAILAKWDYTMDQWKMMIRKETRRRFEEGIWVTLGIGLLGGIIIGASREATFLYGMIISLGVGILVSVLKISLSNSLFKIEHHNNIVIAKQGLLINNKLKILNDDYFKLEYVHLIKIEDKTFLEFSVQWPTRGGTTNDQTRIYVPPQYEVEIPEILAYFKSTGIKVNL